LKSTNASVAKFKSIGDTFERLQAVWAENPGGTYSIFGVVVIGADVMNTYAGHRLFWFDSFTYSNSVSDSVISSSNTTGSVWDDDSTQAALGNENSFTNNVVTFTGNFSNPDDAKYSRISNNVGVNPMAQKTTLFLQGSYLTAFGTATTWANNTVYTVRTNDLLLTISGGTGVNITIWDQSSNVLSTGDATLSARFIPFGYKVNATWTTSITAVYFNWL
jgi:hypothetical protein